MTNPKQDQYVRLADVERVVGALSNECAAEQKRYRGADANSFGPVLATFALVLRDIRALPTTDNEVASLRHNVIMAYCDGLGPKPRCRDCADEDGRCPNSGRLCDPFDAAIEVLRNPATHAGTDNEVARLTTCLQIIRDGLVASKQTDVMTRGILSVIRGAIGPKSLATTEPLMDIN